MMFSVMYNVLSCGLERITTAKHVNSNNFPFLVLGLDNKQTSVPNFSTFFGAILKGSSSLTGHHNCLSIQNSRYNG